MNVPKTCVLCKHFDFSSGSPSYSEWTGGTSCSMSCRRRHWEIDTDDDTEEHVRSCFMKADSCVDFEMRELGISTASTP